jgi:serine/threonine protein kinase
MASEFTARSHGLFGELEPGSRVAGYVIEEQIGAGGMAVVFRARDEMLGRLAAVKVIAPPMAGDPEFRARFLRESRAVAAISSPHIIPVYAAGEADGILYIATRFAAGGDVAALTHRAGGFLAPERAAALVAQVASALDAAHAAGLVHRDVKPQNILIDSTPELLEHAFLSDFGLTKGIGSSTTGLTAAGQFLGTPDYCAPEQIRAASVDGRADQYALGCVAFALLTGEPPFRRVDAMATLFAHAHDPVPSLRAIRPELPAAVDRVIARALAKSPAGRYERCGEFAAALQAALVPAGTTTTAGRPAWLAEINDPEVAPAKRELPFSPSSAASSAAAKDGGAPAREGAWQASTIGGNGSASRPGLPPTQEHGSAQKWQNRWTVLIAGAVALIAAAGVILYALRPAGSSANALNSVSQVTSTASDPPTVASSSGSPPRSLGGAPPSSSGAPRSLGGSPRSSNGSPRSRLGGAPPSSGGSPRSSRDSGPSVTQSHGSSSSAGNSSTTTHGNPVVTGPPGQVTGVTATAGDGTVALAWQAPSGSPTGYQVQVSPVPAGQSASQAVAGATSDKITGLTDGTTYTFTVLASNAKGNGPSSAAVTAVPVGKPVATGPPLVTDTGSTGTSSIIEVSAETSYSTNGSRPQYFTVYEYKASSNGGPFGGTAVTSERQSPVGGSGTVPRFTVLNDGSWYEYAYTVTTAVGTSALSPLSSPALQVPVASATGSKTAAA